MKIKNMSLKGACFVALSGLGGLILTLMGLQVGWIIGSLLMAASLSFWNPALIRLSDSQKEGQQIWLRMGQCILGIHLGQQLDLSVLSTFSENTVTIMTILISSIIFSLSSGYVLYKLCTTDMLTSFYSTAPGGLSAMPGMAQEEGANTAVVTMVQVMRVFMVVLSVPLLITGIAGPLEGSAIENPTRIIEKPDFQVEHLLGTILLVLVAWGGYYGGKFLKIPAPWLVGGMLTVAIFQNFCTMIEYPITAWWPPFLIALAQIMIGSSVGANMKKSMFNGFRKIFIVSFISTFTLMFFMLLGAYLVTKLTGIPFVTTSLAFAPGGVAEMTSTSIALHGDSMFVVAVQVIRIIVVSVTLPPLFRLLHDKSLKKEKKTEVPFHL
jgi:uncharacterized protein